MAITRGTLAKEVNGTVEYIYPRTASDMVIHGNTTVGDQINSLEKNKVDKVDGKSLSTNDFTDSYKDKLDRIVDSDIGMTIDKELSPVSNNAIANSTVTEKLNSVNAKIDDIYINGIGGTSSNSGSVSQEQQQAINTAKNDAVSQAKTYIDQKITNLIGGAPAALDTLIEIANALKDSQDVESVLTNQLATKVNQTDFNEHVNNDEIHVSPEDRLKWDSVSESNHTHSNKYILDNTTASFTTDLERKINSLSDSSSSSQSNWTESDTNSIAYIKNKPTLGTVASKNYTISSTNINDIKNKVPMFDSDGILNVNYIKSGTQDNENPSTISQFIVTTSDGIYRKASLSYVKDLIVAAEGSYALVDHTHNYAGSDSPGGAAYYAAKLTSSAGASNKPVYFSNGVPVAIDYTIEKSVPSNAVFTDSYISNISASKSGSNVLLAIQDTASHKLELPIKAGTGISLNADGGSFTISNTATSSSSGSGDASSFIGILSVANGGTGNTYFTEGEVLIGNNSDSVTTLPIDTTNGGTSSSNDLITSGAVYAGLDTKLDKTTKYALSSSVGGVATCAAKLTTNAGSTTQPVYFSNGVPTNTSYTLSKSVPSNAVFTDTTYTFETGGTNGTIKVTPSDGTATNVSVKGLGTAAYKSSGDFATSGHTHNYAGSSAAGGAATCAAKLTTNAGSTTQPVYFSDGVPTNTSYQLKATVPQYADFSKELISISTGHANGTISTSKTNYDAETGYFTASSGTAIYNSETGETSWSNDIYVKGLKSAAFCASGDFATSGHTHNYAGSSAAGGVATNAARLSTNAGSETQPVYFSNGVPTNTTYSLGKSVPSNAVFTDTTYTFAEGGSNGTIKVTPSGGTATNVSVKGLGTAAYQASTAFATSGHTHNYAASNHSHGAATSAAAGFMSAADKKKLDSIAEGATSSDTNTTYTFETGGTNGTIKVTPSDGTATNVSVKGLGTAAYQASTTFVQGSVTNANTNIIVKNGTSSTAGMYLSSSHSIELRLQNSTTTKQFYMTSDYFLVNNTFRPDTNNSRLLGTSTYKWKEIHGVSIYEDGTLLSNKYMSKQTSVGNTTTPVYLDSDGKFKACTSVSGAGGGGTTYGVVTSTSNGLMSAEDKQQFDILHGETLLYDVYTGSINGTIGFGWLEHDPDTYEWTGNYTSANIAVKGLNTAAYQASTAFATSNHTHSNYLTSQNTAYLYAGTSTGTTNAATTNGNTYLILKDGSTYTRRKINGTGAAQVTSDSSGNITVQTTKWVNRYNELLNSYESLFSKIYIALNNLSEADYIWNALIPAIGSTYLLNTNALLYDSTFSSYIVPKSYSGAVTINPSTVYAGFAFTTSLSYSQRGWMFFIKESNVFDSCTNLYLSTDGQTAAAVHNSNTNLLRLKVNDVNESELSQTVTLDYLSGSPTVQAMQKVRTIGESKYIVCFLMFSSIVHINNIYWRIVDDYGNNDFDDLTSDYRNNILASRIYGLGINTE